MSPQRIGGQGGAGNGFYGHQCNDIGGSGAPGGV